MGNCRGFSLIEMVIALVIISFTVAMLMPSLTKSISNLEQRTSLNKIITTLRYARSQAVTTKRAYQLHLDLSNQSYWLAPLQAQDHTSQSENNLEGNEDPDEKISKTGVSSPVSTLDKQLRIEKVILDSQEGTAAGKAVITFYPRGDSSGGEIVLKDMRDTLHTIVVERMTGRVKLKR